MLKHVIPLGTVLYVLLASAPLAQRVGIGVGPVGPAPRPPGLPRNPSANQPDTVIYDYSSNQLPEVIPDPEIEKLKAACDPECPGGDNPPSELPSFDTQWPVEKGKPITPKPATEAKTTPPDTKKSD